jgi:hypothetical protein
MTEFSKQVLEHIGNFFGKSNYATAVAISPYQAMRLSGVELTGVSFTWNLTRPEPNQVVKAFAITSEVLSGPSLGYHQQQWLSLIARAQNWPGPVSTMSARILNTSGRMSELGKSPADIVRVYDQTVRLSPQLARTWMDAVVPRPREFTAQTRVAQRQAMSDEEWWTEFGEPIQYRQTKWVPPSGRAPVTVITGWPGSGRLVLAQLLYRALAEKDVHSPALRPESFHLVDMSGRAPSSAMTLRDREIIDSCLLQPGAFLYVDLSEAVPGVTGNDILLVANTDCMPLDLLGLCHEPLKSIGFGRRTSRASTLLFQITRSGTLRKSCESFSLPSLGR